MRTHQIGMALTAIGAVVTVAGSAMFVLPGRGSPRWPCTHGAGQRSGEYSEGEAAVH